MALLDRGVHVRIDQIEPGRRAEVAQQPGVDVLRRERLAKQGVVEQLDLSDRQVVGGAQ
jgi:hypothetical protein